MEQVLLLILHLGHRRVCGCADLSEVLTQIAHLRGLEEATPDPVSILESGQAFASRSDLVSLCGHTALQFVRALWIRL